MDKKEFENKLISFLEAKEMIKKYNKFYSYEFRIKDTLYNSLVAKADRLVRELYAEDLQIV